MSELITGKAAKLVARRVTDTFKAHHLKSWLSCHGSSFDRIHNLIANIHIKNGLDYDTPVSEAIHSIVTVDCGYPLVLYERLLKRNARSGYIPIFFLINEDRSFPPHVHRAVACHLGSHEH